MLHAHSVMPAASRGKRPVRMPVDLVWDADAIALIREALIGSHAGAHPAWSWTLGLPYAELQHLCAVVLADDPVQAQPGPALHEVLLAQVPEVFYQHVGLLLACRRSNLPVQNARWLAHAICWSCFAGETWPAHPEALMQQGFASVTLRYFASLPM